VDPACKACYKDPVRLRFKDSMETRHPSSWKSVDLFLVLASLLVLLPCLYYPYASLSPDLGFNASPADWKVVSADPCNHRPESCLETGDQILSIEGVDFYHFSHDRWMSIAKLFGDDGIGRVRLARNGQPMTLDIKVRSSHVNLRQALLLIVAPLIFWLMGTVIVIFLRPRDERWLILVLFAYVTAVWIAAGSGQRTGGSAVVFHAVIWFFLPLAFHLHTILPSEIFGRRVRRALQIFLYALSTALAILDAQLRLEGISYAVIWYTIAAILLSIGLLVLRLVLRSAPATRVAVRIMLFGVTLGLVPFVVFQGVVLLWLKHIAMARQDLQPFGPFITAISLIIIPVLPLSYIYAIYKHHLDTLELRANRLLGIYTFSALLFASYTLVFFALSGQQRTLTPDFLATLLFVSLGYMAAVPLLRDRFQTLVDRHVFGIKHSPEEVIDLVSARIPTAFDREILAGVVAEEILPTLLIRQSALYLFGEGSLETLYEQAVPAGGPPPAEADLRAVLSRSGPTCRRGWAGRRSPGCG